MKSTYSPIEKEKIIAILGGLALFLSLIEYIIPKPIPFIKIGLANIPILISLLLLKPKDIFILILIKSLGAALVSGTLFSWVFLYSLSGSVVSGTVMITTYTILRNRVSMIGISMLGALSSNFTQILLAIKILGPGAKYMGLPILIIGFISGISIGYISNKFIINSKWVELNKE